MIICINILQCLKWFTKYKRTDLNQTKLLVASYLFIYLLKSSLEQV